MTEGPDSLHIVCPHCDTVNRIQAARIDDRPS
jgi:thioredoxin 2